MTPLAHFIVSFQRRFYGWAAPVRLAWYAHCKQCGNFDLQRIPRKHLGRGLAFSFLRLLGARAYRCRICRCHFSSLRAFRRILPAVEPEREQVGAANSRES